MNQRTLTLAVSRSRRLSPTSPFIKLSATALPCGGPVTAYTGFRRLALPGCVWWCGVELRQHSQSGIRSPHKPLLVLLVLAQLDATGSSSPPDPAEPRGRAPRCRMSEAARPFKVGTLRIDTECFTCISSRTGPILGQFSHIHTPMGVQSLCGPFSRC